MCGAAAFGISVRGSACQYIPDGHFHSGTDAHLCAEDPVDFPGTDPPGTLDHEQYGGVYDADMD